MHFGAKFLLRFTMPSVNRGGKGRPPPLESATACACIVGQHFKQFDCRQLKNGTLDEMSAKMSKM